MSTPFIMSSRRRCHTGSSMKCLEVLSTIKAMHGLVRININPIATSKPTQTQVITSPYTMGSSALELFAACYHKCNASWALLPFV
jgi:hypothetical protein